MRNRLLQALPPDELDELWPKLEPVELEMRQILQHPEELRSALHFIETGGMFMLAYMKDGDAAEVGLVSNEGMRGLQLLLDDEPDDLEGMVQGPGTALHLSAVAFHEALERLPNFRRLLHRYALVQHGQVARTAACNGHHDIPQRLARWLLMAHDRAEGDTYPMTHEFLGMMLGVRRAGISVAAGTLQEAGLIHYTAGKITIADRPGLGYASCECYGVTRRAIDGLFGVGQNRTHYRR